MSEPLDDGFTEPKPSANRNTIIIIVTIIALCLCGIIAIILLIARPFASDETPTPSRPEGVTDPVWANILASGRLVVGTSADYPPFEYYTENFQLDGFDIALIREIGHKLGLEVDIKDMAFDGLAAALQINQIDVAISAITITPDREGLFDFSNAYYLSEDALLAAPGSPIKVNRLEEVGLYRLGVQSGTIYEKFAKDQLIVPGTLPAHDLFVYPQMDMALDDLSAGRIDIVILDKAVANQAIKDAGYVMVGQDFYRQQLAIAMPQDSATLKAQLNRALSELQLEGRFGVLVNQYFGLTPEVIPPLPTAEPNFPTPTPFPPAGCLDSMQWVADLSYDDANFSNIGEVSAGSAFQKGWRLRNTGTCTWDSAYKLVPVGGNSPAARMGGLPTPVQGQIAPGQTYDFWVNLTAPLDSGSYVEYWTMSNPVGQLFGDRVWVAINVPGVPTPTPLPTQTPAPGINYSADPELIRQGECSTLTWSTSNVQAVYHYPQGESWHNFGVPGSGSQVVCPGETTTYELRVIKNNGSVEIRTVTIHVTPNANAPVISRFTVEPPYEIVLGQCVQITWIVEGAVDKVNLARDGVAFWPNAPFSGGTQDCPVAAGELNYGIEATGPGGTSRLQQFIRVTTPVLPPTPPPEATVAPTTVPPTATPIPEPTIYSFSAVPNQVGTGQCLTLAWRVGGNTNRIQILKNNRIVVEDGAFQDSVLDCDLKSAGMVVYEIKASNDSGGTAIARAQAVVVDLPPDSPLAGTQWQLESMTINNSRTEMPSNSREPVISLNFEVGGQYAGFSGCNIYGGAYTESGRQIVLTAPNNTNKLCEPATNQQEFAYLGALAGFSDYQITADEKLILSDSAGNTVFTFEELVLIEPF